jgi:hypothetical protein
MSAVPLLEVSGTSAVPSERPRRSAPAAQVSVWPVTQGGATVVSIDEARRRLRQETAGNVSVDTDAVTVAGAHAGAVCCSTRAPMGSAAVAGARSAAEATGTASSVLPRVDFAAVALRIVAWSVAVVVAFSVALGLGLALRPAPYGGETYVHSVTAGESVWGLAESLGSSRALEDVVADIVSLNALDANVLHPGQELLLPAE